MIATALAPSSSIVIRMPTLNNPGEVQRFFRDNQTPIYYFSTTTFNLLGAEEWIGGMKFINVVDSYDGFHPAVFIPNGLPANSLDSFETCNNALLSHPAVDAYVCSRGP